jgi:hypothetical protein
MLEDKIFNNAFDNVEYGTERTTQSAIAINPCVEDRYEESVAENIEDIYTKRKLMDLMETLYKESPFHEKYNNNNKKIERCDFFDIYYHFKEELLKREEFTIIQIFCTIAEFFDLNYRTLYNDILTLEDKVSILDQLEKDYGLEKQFTQSKALF